MVAIVNNHQFTSLNPQSKVTPATKQFEGVEQHPSAYGFSHKPATEKDAVQVSAEGRFVAAVAEFEKAVLQLREEERAKAKVKNPAIVQVRVSDEATARSLNINITNIASAQELHSARFADPDAELGGGTLSFSSALGSFKITVAGGLKHIAEQINTAEDNFGITASLQSNSEGTRLVLRADRVGAGAAFTVAANPQNTKSEAQTLAELNYNAESGTALRQVSAAQNAHYEIDGRSYASETNVVESGGMVLHLTAPGATRVEVEQSEGRSLDDIGGKLKTALNRVVDELDHAAQGDDKLRGLIAELRGRLRLDGDDLHGMVEAGVLKRKGKGFGLDVNALQQTLEPVIRRVAQATASSAHGTDPDAPSLKQLLTDNLTRMADGSGEKAPHSDNGKRHNDNGLAHRSEAAPATATSGEARAKHYAEVQAATPRGFDF